ncbi:hypothetical protein V2O64_16235 [Verrucomicrobiaceae bacterium 227]
MIKTPIKSFIFALYFCVSSLVPATGLGNSRNTNPALLYWQAAAELPALSDPQAKQLGKVASGKADFHAEILDELNFERTVKFLRKVVASEAPCDWGLAWEEGIAMPTPHVAKMLEFSTVTLVLAESKFANDETAEGIDFLLMAHHISRDLGVTPLLINNVAQNALERRAIAAAARHCMKWDAAEREDYARRLAALPELNPLHRAFLTELLWVDRFKNKLEGNFEEASMKLGLSALNNDQLESPELIEEMIGNFRKMHARAMAVLKLEGEARNLALTELGKEIAAHKDLPGNVLVSLLMPTLDGMVRSEDQTLIARAMLESALEHGPEISEKDLDGNPFQWVRKDGVVELNSEGLDFSLKFGK